MVQNINDRQHPETSQLSGSPLSFFSVSPSKRQDKPQPMEATSTRCYRLQNLRSQKAPLIKQTIYKLILTVRVT